MSRVYKVQGNAVCEVCGNMGCQCFEVQIGAERHVFDSFECALDVLTPQCERCRTPFVGQGVRAGGMIYCSHECVNAARVEGCDLFINIYEKADLQEVSISA